MPGLPKLPHLLKKDGKNLVGTLVAKEWLTLVKIGAFVFPGVLDQIQIKCWNVHVKYLEQLRQWDISGNDLTAMLEDTCHVQGSPTNAPLVSGCGDRLIESTGEKAATANKF